MSIFASDKVYCDSYDCPDNYKLVDDGDNVMCKDKKCTKKQCCKKGESSPNDTLREVGDKEGSQNIVSARNILHYQMSLSILPLPTANYKSSGNLIRFGYVGRIWEA